MNLTPSRPLAETGGKSRVLWAADDHFCANKKPNPPAPFPTREGGARKDILPPLPLGEGVRGGGRTGGVSSGRGSKQTVSSPLSVSGRGSGGGVVFSFNIILSFSREKIT